jgi:hypothetical protein
VAGHGHGKGALNRDPFARRDFHQGAHSVRDLKRRDEPTTFIDHERVPRFPKRADFFARALFGDLGKGAGRGQERALRDEEPDRRLRASGVGRAAAAAVRRRARPGVADHRRPAAQRR